MGSRTFRKDCTVIKFCKAPCVSSQLATDFSTPKFQIGIMKFLQKILVRRTQNFKKIKVQKKFRRQKMVDTN